MTNRYNFMVKKTYKNNMIFNVSKQNDMKVIRENSCDLNKISIFLRSPLHFSKLEQRFSHFRTKTLEFKLTHMVQNVSNTGTCFYTFYTYILSECASQTEVSVQNALSQLKRFITEKQ